MKLYDNWVEILRRAWSVRLMLLAGILTGIEVALPMLAPVLSGTVIPTGLFSALAGLSTAAALVARLIAQPKI